MGKTKRGAVSHHCWCVLIILIFRTEFLLTEGALTPDEIIIKLEDAKEFLNNPDNLDMIEKTETLLGPLPEPGLAGSGIRNRFQQAYHFNIYGVRYWDRGKVWQDYLNGVVLVFVRKFQLVWNNLNETVTKCNEKLRVAYEAEKNSGVVNGTKEKYFVGNCSKIQEDFSDGDKELLEIGLRRIQVSAMFLTAMDFSIACDMPGSKYLGIPYHFNGGEIYHPKAYTTDVGLWSRISSEYEKLGNEIEAKLAVLQAHANQAGNSTPYGQMISSAYNNITLKLAAYPFTEIYEADSRVREEKLKTLKGTGGILFGKYNSDTLCGKTSMDNFEPSNDVVDPKTNEIITEYYTLIDETRFSFHWFELANVTDYDKKWYADVLTIPELYESIIEIYETYLKVEPLAPNDPRKNNITFWDGKWDWQITGNDPLNHIHRARLGWELLGSVLEEVKCYLNESYDMEKRRAVLEERKLFNWTNASIYMEISPTLFRPCKTANETDWVGNCTKENHEICMPIPYGPNQDPESEVHGGLSLLKPQWVYMKLDGVCKGIRTYVPHFKICQCGFREDCGSDLGPNVEITCQFVENDMIRKQCRGSIAYPCKTHPFAPGKYHRTCATNYCDEKHNSCERYHPKIVIQHEFEPDSFYE